MRYRIGVIGLGSIGQRMLSSIEGHARFDVSSAWDPSPVARERTQTNHPGVILTTGPGDVTGARDVDLVYVACPPGHHRDHALAAVEAGKAVLCEKPLGVDLDLSRDLVERVEASGVANAVNLLYAAARGGELIGAALADGSLGELVWVEVRLHVPGWNARRTAEAPWLAGRAEGGFVREVVTHYVFLLQRLLGPITVRWASLRHREQAGSAEYFASIELSAGGVPVTIAGTNQGVGPELSVITFWGTQASWRLRDIHLLERAEGDAWVAVFSPPANPERDTHLRQLDQLARLLDGKSHTMPDFRAALGVQEVIEAIVGTSN